jgi:hypothetical protein
MKGACVYMKFIPEPLVSKCQQCQQCQQCSQFSEFLPVKYKFIPVKYKFPNFYPLNTNLDTNFRTDSNTFRTDSNKIQNRTDSNKIFRTDSNKIHNFRTDSNKIQNLVFMHLDDPFCVSMSPSRCIDPRVMHFTKMCTLHILVHT